MAWDLQIAWYCAVVIVVYWNFAVERKNEDLFTQHVECSGMFYGVSCFFTVLMGRRFCVYVCGSAGLWLYVNEV